MGRMVADVHDVRLGEIWEERLQYAITKVNLENKGNN